MMEGASNGGMLYHEVQESKLCAVHCVNTVLQGPFFSEFDLAALASDLDRTERQMMMLPALSSSGDFLSHNVSLDGDFSIQARHACDARFWLGDVSYICCSLPNPEASIAGNGVTTLMCRLVHRSRYVIKYDQQYVPEQSKQVGFDTVYQHPFICPIATRDSTLVLQKALEVWDLQVIPLDSPVAEPAQIDPELENAFICHLQDHWFCIRKVNGEWYNFDSLYAAPQHLSKFYLAAYLDSLKGFGWSIFLVRGNFPKEFPISSSEASNGFGQWLSPEDAERITKSCNSVQAPQGRINENQDRLNQQFPSHDEAEMFSDMEDEDLKAAIAASLMDSSPAVTNAEAGAPQNDKQSSKQVATTEATPLSDQQNKQLEPIEASLPPSDQSNKDEAAIEAGSLLNDKNNQEVASPVDGKPQSENQNK